MHIIVFYVFVTHYLHINSVRSDGISSKLDFGQEDEHTEPVILIQTPDKLARLEVAQQKGTQTVVCSASGCNKTEIKQDNKDDIVSDVVVHVKTSVNLPKHKNETIDETPDVPVVLGYGGANPTFSSNDFVNTNTNPIAVGNLESGFPDQALVPIPSPTYQQRHPTASRKFYEPNYKQVSYDTNLLYVPYLEPSFHNYHFGEQPPLQYVWTPKGGAGLNPVEFKRFERPTWRKPQWNHRSGGSYHSHGTTPGYTTCTCQNPGLNWYPTTPTWNIQNRNLNSGIDDKLATLN